MTHSEDENKPLEQTHSLSARRAVVLLIVFIALQYVFGFLLAIPIGFYVAAATDLGHMDPSAIDAYMAPFELPVAILSLFFSALIIFRMTRRSLPGPIGGGALASLGWKSVSGSSILLACVIGILISAGYLFILVPAVPPADEQTWGPLATAAIAGGWQRFFWAVLVLLLAPPIEEYVFRGILYTGLCNAFGTYISAVVVTFLFVIAHVTEVMHYWPAWIGISLLAVVMIILRIRTKSLVPAIAAHFSYNLVLVVMAYLA